MYWKDLQCMLVFALLVGSAGDRVSQTCPNALVQGFAGRLVRRQNLVRLLQEKKRASVVDANPRACTAKPRARIPLRTDYGSFELLGRMTTQLVHVMNTGLGSTGDMVHSSNNLSAFATPACNGSGAILSVLNQVISSFIPNVLPLDINVLSIRTCSSSYPSPLCFFWLHTRSDPSADWQHGSAHLSATNAEWWEIARRSVAMARLMANSDHVVTIHKADARAELSTRLRRHFMYSPGFWTTPYYDCNLLAAWKETYTMPLYVVDSNLTIHDIGSTSIDIDLRSADLDECSSIMPQGMRANASSMDIELVNTHLCDATSTSCLPQRGQGLIIGSYHCYCRKGYYKESSSLIQENEHFFTGQSINAALGPLLSNSNLCSDAEELKEVVRQAQEILQSRFACKPCPLGCETCHSSKDVCIDRTSVLLLSSLLALNALVVGLDMVLIFVVVHFRRHPVFRSASWVFLVIILVGCIIPVIGISVGPTAGLITGGHIASHLACTVKIWTGHIGFILSYGSVLLKTYRLFEVFSSRRLSSIGPRHLTNFRLLQVLLVLVLIYASLLLSTVTNNESLSMAFRVTVNNQRIKRFACRSIIADIILKSGK